MTLKSNLTDGEPMAECSAAFILSILNSDNKTGNLTQYGYRKSHSSAPELVNFYLNRIAIPVLCVVGIIGNILNLLILTRKRLRSTMDRMEKSAHFGLIALAISDMMFCLVALPMGFIPGNLMFPHKNFVLSYKLYSNALLNIFLMSSTWFTVVMATGRYLAICRPLHARGMINFRCTFIAIISVFIIAVGCNIPYFLRYHAKESWCLPTYSPNCRCYIIAIVPLFKNNLFKYLYDIIWATIGVFVPFLILFISNICLIRALRQSANMRRKFGQRQPALESQNRFTPTLISIIVLFFVCVCPSEFLKFHENFSPASSFDAYMIAKYIANFLQLVNFSINFVLYFAINVYFRQTIKEYLFCLKLRKKKQKYAACNHTVSFRVTEQETVEL